MTADQRKILTRIVETKKFGLAEGVGKSKRVMNGLLASSPAIDSPNFTSFSKDDLRKLFDLIDAEFFDHSITETLKRKNFPLEFRVSKRMTNSGGITTTRYPRNRRNAMEFEIAISSTLLFGSFKDNQPILVTGLLCGDRLQALKRIMEHEMIHLIEMLLWRTSSCSARRFQGIARRLFSHKQSTHQLITPTDSAETKYNISAGDWVSFQTSDRQQLFGFVNRITKRATVLVPSDRGTRYTDGKSYMKFYVPIHQLRKAS